MKERTPGNVVASRSREVKRAWKQAGKPTSLKVWAHETAMGSDDAAEMSRNWFHNKRVNTSKPPKGIGSTRKKKGQQGKK